MIVELSVNSNSKEFKIQLSDSCDYKNKIHYILNKWISLPINQLIPYAKKLCRGETKKSKIENSRRNKINRKTISSIPYYILKVKPNQRRRGIG